MERDQRKGDNGWGGEQRKWKGRGGQTEVDGDTSIFMRNLKNNIFLAGVPANYAWAILSSVFSLWQHSCYCFKLTHSISCVPYLILPFGCFSAVDFVQCTNLVMGRIVPDCTLPFCTYLFCLFAFLLLLLLLLTDGKDDQTPLRNFYFVLNCSTLNFLDSFEGINTTSTTTTSFYDSKHTSLAFFFK